MSEPAYTPQQIAALFLDALREGNVSLAEQMLDAGIDRDAPDPRGFPPLVIAAYAGQGDVALAQCVEEQGGDLLGGVGGL